ncbi:MAG: methylmalonyl-CoA mutase [Chloroflexi bacterium]|nr:methylmalonyl-CoA mutase [Chloroflexota bacterium]
MFEKAKIDELKTDIKKWEKENSARLRTLRKPVEEFATESGIPVKTVYTPADLSDKGFDYSKDLGLPGQYPFTRGVSPSMYREKLWHSSIYSGYPTPEECNDLWKTIVAGGGREIFIAFDLPTQLGIDPDNKRAEGEVGRVGVSLSSLKDWEIGFDGIDLRKISLSVNLNAPGIIAIATHLTLAKQRGLDLAEIEGTCQNDILKEYTARGNFIYAPKHGVRLVGDTLAYCAGRSPLYRPIQICGMHFGDSGVPPVREVALALCDAIAYYDDATKKGINIDDIAPGVSFLMCTEYDSFFDQIAALRAMRKLYARILKERYGAKKPESLMAHFFGGQGGKTYTRQQYLNNIGRITLSVLAGALAGCERIVVSAYDEQFGIPTKDAMLTTARIQNILSYETGVPDTVDPLGGSYFVESLTLESEEKIEKELDEIMKNGGAIACIESGYIQAMLARDGYKWIKDRQEGKVPWVGVNLFTTEEEDKPLKVYRANPATESQRREAVRELRKKRDNQKVNRALDEIKATAALPPTKENSLMPSVMEAVGVYATVGEICDALRSVWGEWREPGV